VCSERVTGSWSKDTRSEPIPATNKPIRLRYAFIAKVEGGKFAETNLYFDVAGMMAQLGLGPGSPGEDED
jgi:hypothetical protein